jgi:hypothetical protein
VHDDVQGGLPATPAKKKIPHADGRRMGDLPLSVGQSERKIKIRRPFVKSIFKHPLDLAIF